ncbi:MAG TPA: hypothetical protein VKB25_05335 [Conexibacter sp.]|nr:hypothetical protein [Conexibacter sp.]
MTVLRRLAIRLRRYVDGRRTAAIWSVSVCASAPEARGSMLRSRKARTASRTAFPSAPISIDEGWQRSAGWNFPSESSQPADPGDAREQAIVRTGRSTADTATTAYAPFFHVRLSRFLITATAFNLGPEGLESRFLEPWRVGRAVVLNGRHWDRERARITIYQGPRLSTQQRYFGTGWSNAVKFGEDVTDSVLRGQGP